MRIARIVGTAQSTLKNEKLHGRRLLIARETDLEGRPRGESFVAVDTVDARAGDLVVITEGSSARQTDFTIDLPVDAVVVAVLDSLQVGGETTFRKG